MPPEEPVSAVALPDTTSGDFERLSAEVRRLAEENRDLTARVARAEEAVRTLRRALRLTGTALKETGLLAEQPEGQDWGKTPPAPLHEAGLLIEKVRTLLPDED